MSIIHVGHVKTHVKRLFDTHIDLKDAQNAPAEQQEDFFYTRALSACAVHFSLRRIGRRGGAFSDRWWWRQWDLMHLLRESSRRLYLVQSKWIKSGNGERDNGKVKKFVARNLDLFDLQFHRFNAKVRR